MQAFIPPKTAIELARDRLRLWRAGTTLPSRQDIVDMLTVIGIE